MKQRSGFDSGGSAHSADEGDRQDRAPRGVRFEERRGGDRNGGFSARRFPRHQREREREPRAAEAKKRKVRIYFTESVTRIPLPKLLTRARYLSPALAQRFIESGRVRVNARVVMSPIYEVNLRKERVTIDEVATEFPRQVTYMVYNKPRGVVCERGDPAFDDIFDPHRVWTFPFGRLSRAMSGLVIVSGDPRSVTTQHVHDTELQKEYRVKVNRVLDDAEVDHLRRGVESDGDYFVPVRVSVRWRNASSMWLDISVLDDAPHHLFVALKALGCEVLSIRRIRISLLHENMVPPGEWRELGAQEVAMLGLQRFLRGELPPEPPPPPRPKSFRERERERERGRRGGRGDRSRGDRPRGDRARDDRPRGDRPRDDRGRDDRSRGDRPRDDRRNDRPRDERPRGERRDDRPRDDRPRDERRGDRPRDDRPREDRPRDDRPRGDRNGGDRPRDDRPRGDRRPDFPRGDRPRDDRPRDDRPRDDRPRDDRPRDDRPRGDRPRDDRPRDERPRDDRPRDDRPRDDRPRDERRSGDRPRDDRPRDDRRRDDRPRGDRPRGDQREFRARDDRPRDDRRDERPRGDRPRDDRRDDRRRDDRPRDERRDDRSDDRAGTRPGSGDGPDGGRAE